MAKRLHRSTRRKAIAALELAMVLPLLVLLCLAAVDLARGCHVGITLASAVRAGADYAATRRLDEELEDEWRADIINEVQQELASAESIDLSRATVVVDVTFQEGGLHICRVYVEYPFETVVSWPMTSSPIVMRREVKFRRYR
jgi:Flp pilus assembly protein TadG